MKTKKGRPKIIKIIGEKRKFKIVDKLGDGTYAVAFSGNEGIFGYVRPTGKKDVYKWD